MGEGRERCRNLSFFHSAKQGVWHHSFLNMRRNGGGWWAGRALTFRKFPEKMDIGSKKMYLQEVCEGGQKNQGHVTFPRKSRAVVGDIRKNGQNFGDLNFHKI